MENSRAEWMIWWWGGGGVGVGWGEERRSAHVITREDSGLVRQRGEGRSVIAREDSGLVRQRREGGV